MKYFRIVYERKDTREVWVEIDETKLGSDEIINSRTAMQMFWDDFEKYDKESESHYGGSDTEVLLVDEVDENGEEI